MQKLTQNKITEYILYAISVVASLGFAFLIAKLSYLVLVLLIIVLVIIAIFTKNKYIPLIILFSIVGGQLARYNLADRGGIVVSDALIPVVLFSWLIFKFAKDKKFTYSHLNLAIIGFLVILIFSYAINYNYFSIGGFFYLLRLVGYILIYFVFLDFINIKNFKSYINLLMIIGIVLSVLGFIQLKYFPDFSIFTEYNWDPHQNRLLSTFFDPNYLGAFLAILIAIGISMFLSAKTVEEKSCYFISCSIMLPALVLTYSRSGLLALAVMIFIIGILRSWKLLVISIITVFLIVSFNPRLMARIEGALSIDETAKLRLLNWEESYKLIKLNPYFGVGYNNILDLKIEQGLVKEDDLSSHSVAGSDNSFLTIAIATGIFGLIFFILFLIIIIIDSFKMFFNKKNPDDYRNYSLAVLAITLGLIIHSQFVNSFLYPHILLLYIFILALFYKIYSLKENNK